MGTSSSSSLMIVLALLSLNPQKRFFIEEGDLGKVMNHIYNELKIHIKVVLEQPPSVARDVEKLKRGKSNATLEQRFGDKLGGLNSCHHQRPFDNVSNYRYYDMLVQNSYPFHEVDIKEGSKLEELEVEEENFPRYKASHEDNLYEDYEENLMLVKLTMVVAMVINKGIKL
ncbi:hypothetical protein M9H77_13094 [Catharanthus roseus]|uniref:Uncharacterized protein n=1 Tax=Catharanthus roseus TaxID=4058 RepID=A0ACC0BJA2_CATRO|nr:hypothetical protein M9H77_13094 [Catharanthus roseus]